MVRRRYSGLFAGLMALYMVAGSCAAVAQDASTGTTTGTATELRPAATTSSAAGVASNPKLHEKIRTSRRLAYMMAKYEWLDKVAEANPVVIAAICERPGPARILARHKHIAEIAEADHYLCRRLTQWKSATAELIKNPHLDRVIALDPTGIYTAIARDPGVARVLASHTTFNEMIATNPDLARVIAEHSAGY